MKRGMFFTLGTFETEVLGAETTCTRYGLELVLSMGTPPPHLPR